jgi:hypothetical protein
MTVFQVELKLSEQAIVTNSVCIPIFIGQSPVAWIGVKVSYRHKQPILSNDRKLTSGTPTNNRKLHLLLLHRRNLEHLEQHLVTFAGVACNQAMLLHRGRNEGTFRVLGCFVGFVGYVGSV